MISVSDKRGIVEFAAGLASEGVEILSTGGTANTLSKAGIEIIPVSDYTGFPELMGGRLKTLHPKIHGGILAREDVDKEEMQENDIQPIDLIVVNLYPFEQAHSDRTTDYDVNVEFIDIGGPTMIRAAAKNFIRTSVVIDPSDYQNILNEIHNKGGIAFNTRKNLAAKAFARVSEYDSNIASALRASTQLVDEVEEFPNTLNLTYRKFMDMRYGENPHQAAAFYVPFSRDKPWLETSQLHQGKSMSFNNVVDADAAYSCIKDFHDTTSCVIVKHATPCGVASATNLTSAYELAYRTDPTSAFGGIIAFNRKLDERTAVAILDNQFVEVILAPEIEQKALKVFRDKENIRVLEYKSEMSGIPSGKVLSSAGGGLLLQDPDETIDELLDIQVVTEREPEKNEMQDLIFAWGVAKHVKSNAIVYAKDFATIGIGAGQMSRVDSAKIALIKADEAGLEINGSVMASDAFFPFRDAIDAAAKSGIRAVIQPGGSLRDNEVIDAANEHCMSMVFTGRRHFRH